MSESKLVAAQFLRRRAGVEPGRVGIGQLRPKPAVAGTTRDVEGAGVQQRGVVRTLARGDARGRDEAVEEPARPRLGHVQNSPSVGAACRRDVAVRAPSGRGPLDWQRRGVGEVDLDDPAVMVARPTFGQAPGSPRRLFVRVALGKERGAPRRDAAALRRGSRAGPA